MLISAVALGFLIYSLANLSRLGIRWFDLRVLVEFGIFIVLAIGLYIRSGC